MSLPHFYLEHQIIADEADAAEPFALDLSAADAKHARVLRLQPKEHVAIIDAASDYFEVEVDSFDSVLMVHVASRLTPPQLPHVTLVQGLAKGDKMETVIRHATELGVRSFVPLACERSVVKLNKEKSVARVKRWQTVAKSAAMQSGLGFVPHVHDVSDVADCATLFGGAACVLVCWEEAEATCIADALSAVHCSFDDDVVVVVGPEGGLCAHEVQALCDCNAHSYCVTLGPTILRTETAGIVAGALVIYELGGLR